jgi:hypothetical protein
MTWYIVKPALPYHQDADYRDSFIQAIKVALGQDIPVDITLLESWGQVEVDTDLDGMRLLQGHAMVGGEIRANCDRYMLTTPRTIV